MVYFELETDDINEEDGRGYQGQEALLDVFLQAFRQVERNIFP